MNDTIDVDLGGPIVSFKQLDVNTICENPVIVIIGKRGSGKSWLCRHLLNKVIGPNTDAGAIFCPSEKFTSFYSKCFPDLFIHEKFTNGDLSKILHRQDVVLEQSQSNVKSFILLDDSLGGDTFRNQSIIEPLINSRHYKLSFVLTMQFPLQVPPETRCNFDYVFLFRDDIYSNIKRIYDHYGGIFPTFESFRRAFKTLTEDFGAMVIVNRGYSHGITDKIFWIKAEDIEEGDFIGSESFWDYHNKHYCGNHNEHYCGNVDADVDADSDVFMYSAFANVNKMRNANHDQTQIDVPYVNVDGNTDSESDNESIFSTSNSDNSDTDSL